MGKKEYAELRWRSSLNMVRSPVQTVDCTDVDSKHDKNAAIWTKEGQQQKRILRGRGLTADDTQYDALD